MDVATEHQAVSEVTAELGFSLPAEVIEDHEGRAIKRAATRPLDYGFELQFEKRSCRVRDWSTAGQPQPGLQSMGFEAIDLCRDQTLQSLLADLRQAGAITPPQARSLRRRLDGQVFQLAGGKLLKLLQVAGEGLIMRKGGPNGLQVDPDVKMSEMNDHDVALAVHGDQDVRGTPLKQMMRGFAPWMFRHQTPDGSNTVSPLVLVNLWIPLQQVTRPLSLMDRRTLNTREHQLRYALPTDTFLNRNEEMRFNDIWAFLYDDAQHWYFNAGMGHEQAYIFDTLGEPHGSFILPGEDVAEHYYKVLRLQLQQVEEGSVEQVPLVVPELPADTTAPLRKAIVTMATLAANAPLSSEQPGVEAWMTSARHAMDSVVRKSLEMRVVAVLLPDRWPFNKSLAS
jgi:hypothetical protein